MQIEIPNSIITSYIQALDKSHDANISSLRPKERYAVSNNLMEKRQVLENYLYSQIIKPKNEDDTTPTEHYEVWVTLEKWDGDSKLEDVQTTKLFENTSEENAELVWQLCEGVSIAAKNGIDGLFFN